MENKKFIGYIGENNLQTLFFEDGKLIQQEQANLKAGWYANQPNTTLAFTQINQQGVNDLNNCITPNGQFNFQVFAFLSNLENYQAKEGEITYLLEYAVQGGMLVSANCYSGKMVKANEPDCTISNEQANATLKAYQDNLTINDTVEESTEVEPPPPTSTETEETPENATDSDATNETVAADVNNTTATTTDTKVEQALDESPTKE